MQQSAGKVMATVFWNVYYIIHIDYLEEGKKSLPNIRVNYCIDSML